MPTPMRVLLVDADQDSSVLMRGLMAGMAVPADVERAATYDVGLERMSSPPLRRPPRGLPARQEERRRPPA